MVALKRRWRIRRWLTIGLFAFQRIAMYRDLDPERWNQGLERRPLLVELLGGTEERVNPLFAEEHEVDDPEIARHVPLLITDADSSQFSAIVDIMRGCNLAIEGPPGTGKSQTITNIIAGAMAEGKRVLFLAEKMAALEVVKARLDHAGLGEFCLELHSTKARKKEVLEGFVSRLKLQESADGPARLEGARRELEELKRQLSRYVELINRPFGAEQLSIQQLLWAEQCTRGHRSQLPDGVERVEIAGAESMDSFARDRANHVLAEVEQRDAEIRAAFESAKTHPWRGVQAGDLTPYDREVLVGALNACRNAVRNVVDLLDDLARVCGVGLKDMRLRAVGALVTDLKALPNATSALDDTTFARLGDPAALEAVTALHEALERRSASLRAQSVAEDEERLLEHRTTVEALVRVAERLGVADIPFEALSDRGIEMEAEAEAWRQVVGLARRIAGGFGGDERINQRMLARYLESVEIVAATDRRALKLRTPELTSSSSWEIISSAAVRARELRDRRDTLRRAFYLQDAPSTAEARAHAAAARNAGWINWFDHEFKAARRAHQRLWRHGKADKSKIASDFAALADHLEAVEQLKTDHTLRQACGPHFAGLDTDFEGLLGAARFTVDVCTRFSGHDQASRNARLTLLEAKIEIIDALANCGREPEFANLRTAVNRPGDPDEPLLERRDGRLLESARALCSIRDAAAKLRLRSDACPESLSAALDRAQALRSARHAVEQNETARLALGEHFQGIKTDPSVLARLIGHAQAVAQTNVPAPIRAYIHSGGQSRTLPDLQARAEKLQSAFERADRTLSEAISENTQIDASDFLGVDYPIEMPARALIARLTEALEASEALAGWCAYAAALEQASAAGLRGLLAAYDAIDAPYHRLADAFHRAFVRTMVQRAFLGYPELRRCSGLTQAQARRRFQKLDREILGLERRALRAKLAARPIDPGSNVGPAASHTGLRLVEREIGKQRRHIPLRDMLSRAGRAVQDMKPCFMMSPLSVAQYLTPDQIDFDILVIDEASQMRPEDALGAIARAHQVVVVGDPKQLPPTSFFDRLDEPPEEEEAVDPESILGLALNAFRPARRLRWHYRSRHDSLIAFSNRRFYDDDLIVFPSPHELGNGFGIEYRHVAGTYEGRCNVVEARTVAEAAIEFMREHRDLSLGVVAVNRAQAELIHREVYLLIARDRAAAEYEQFWEGRLESFFVKNLETVQGDERDVIMISTVYGPDRNGAVHQRFGPINSELGWRRLNVLFTRAKHRLVLFSSMHPNDIRIGPDTRRGVHEFRAYLEYAATGRLERGEATQREPDSDFEICVRDRLKDKGYEVVPQVGVAGYFIDLAVRHPACRNGFLLGIECDGAMYHSAKSARDRDRLREEVLTCLGWRLYRIWSTDWFNDQARELQRLVTHIEQLARADAAD